MGGNTTVPPCRRAAPMPLAVGDEIVLSGRVSEFFFLTQLSSPRVVVQQVVQSGVLGVDTAVPAFEANPPFNPSTGAVLDVAEVNRYWERREGMRARVPTGVSIARRGRRSCSPATEDAEIRRDPPVTPRSPSGRTPTRGAPSVTPHPLDNLPELFDDNVNPYRILMGSIGVKGALNDPDAHVLPPTSARTFATLSNDAIGGAFYFSFSKYGVQPSAASFAAVLTIRQPPA